MPAPAHGRQERHFIAVGHRLRQIMRHALIDDQPRPRRFHGRTQQRLLARHPILEILEGAHVTGQRNLG